MLFARLHTTARLLQMCIAVGRYPMIVGNGLWPTRRVNRRATSRPGKVIAQP
eukprot:COSAG02_NODE_422_length_22587_cov_10.209089_21_plen_52_part_00